jgi:argininosuccinate lyase
MVGFEVNSYFARNLPFHEAHSIAQETTQETTQEKILAYLSVEPKLTQIWHTN